MKTAIRAKLIHRWLLALIAAFGIYFTLKPDFSFYQWVPHRLLRDLGIPYSWVLGFERYGDKLAHLLIAAILVILLVGARFYFPRRFNPRLISSVLLVTATLFMAELAQHKVGRGFTSADIVAGIVGIAIACGWLLMTRSTKTCNNP